VSRLEIDVRDVVLPRHVQVLGALHRLGITVDTRSWVLVGGLMVMLLGKERGGVSARSSFTKDGDVVVDVVADARVLGKVVGHLIAEGLRRRNRSPVRTRRDARFRVTTPRSMCCAPMMLPTLHSTQWKGFVLLRFLAGAVRWTRVAMWRCYTTTSASKRVCAYQRLLAGWP
jgi:hypothetical protein